MAAQLEANRAAAGPLGLGAQSEIMKKNWAQSESSSLLMRLLFDEETTVRFLKSVEWIRLSKLPGPGGDAARNYDGDYFAERNPEALE